MKKVKVLFTFYALPPYLIALLNELSKKLEVIVILPEKSQITKGKNVFEEHDNAEFKIIRLPQKKHWLTRKEILVDIKTKIKSIQPDYLITCWPYVLQIAFDFFFRKSLKSLRIQWGLKHIPYQIPYYNHAMQFYKTKGIFDENLNVEKADTFLKYCKFYILKELNKFLFNSAEFHFCYLSESPKILESYGVNPQNVIVTYNSGDTPKLLKAYEYAKNQIEELDSKFRFIFVGRLVKWKKVDQLIHTFSNLVSKYQNVELIIVGEGPELVNLRLLVEKLNLADFVIFTGGIFDPLNLAKQFYKSHVFVLTGAGGLAINDAMTFGKPVICTYADGTEKDLVIPEKTGFIYENEDELEKYMEYFINNPSKAMEMGKNAQNKILTEINLHTVAEKYLNFILNNHK